MFLKVVADLRLDLKLPFQKMQNQWKTLDITAYHTLLDQETHVH